MDQKIINIRIEDLVLWTENPRDLINENATDQEIVNRALGEKNNKWTLNKLAQDMGKYYDYSELPTVVYQDHKPVVYDGNRRVLLGKIKHKLVEIENSEKFYIPDFPEVLPCNVCSKEIALINIYRKHSKSGSWNALERDFFLWKHMHKEKSTYVILDECTGLISNNPHLNKDFVKKEIFSKNGLEKLGFKIIEGQLQSKHSSADSELILNAVSDAIKKKYITTRKNRGNIIGVLKPDLQKKIDKDKDNLLRELDKNLFNYEQEASKITERQTQRSKAKTSMLFGNTLYLSNGNVNNLYRDLKSLYEFYLIKKRELSEIFPNIIRMALRLLCETAANEENRKLDKYLQLYFDKAKNKLDQDAKTTLSNQNVTSDSIVKLLQSGAHGYSSSSNIEQTLALPYVIGGIISLSHGKKNE